LVLEAEGLKAFLKEIREFCKMAEIAEINFRSLGIAR
jgi:hypothetical protein